MEQRVALPASALIMDAIHSTLRAVPIACFGLTLASDVFYWQTSNLLWLHFSEWLLFAGTVFGGLALLAAGLDFLIRRLRPAWSAVLFGVIVLILATINNLVHTTDGWTAVVPTGLILSAATVLAMIVTAWLAQRGRRHV